MAEDTKAKKTIELWEGYSVEVNEQLLDDFDFISDLGEAARSKNTPEMIAMYFAVVGGDDTYKKVREYITKKYGYFSQEGFTNILEKIDGAFPKAGNRAQRRSWKTSH